RANLMIQHLLYLLLGYPWKPGEEVCYGRPIAQVLKKGRHGHAGATKAPGTTQHVWRALNGIKLFERLRIHDSSPFVHLCMTPCLSIARQRTWSEPARSDPLTQRTANTEPGEPGASYDLAGCHPTQLRVAALQRRFVPRADTP